LLEERRRLRLEIEDNRWVGLLKGGSRWEAEAEAEAHAEVGDAGHGLAIAIGWSFIELLRGRRKANLQEGSGQTQD
jgi:hypothetical protein